MTPRAALAAALVLVAAGGAARAQDITPQGFRLPPMPPITATTPAKELFGRVTRPSEGRGRSLGFYSKGCLAGADALPLSGPTWQVMRPSRNRFYGRAQLVTYIQRLSKRVADTTAWPGILVGDMSQPRGGPMLKGHASHQIGLDVDVWLRPMPRVEMTMTQRETMMSTNVVAADRADVGAGWTPDHLKVIRAAALDPQVERILVNPAIKKAICRDARGDRGWVQKVRPQWGHDYHFHVRLGCPAGESSCKPQADVAPGDGCGKALDWWFTPGRLFPLPPKIPPKPRPPMTLKDMPAECTDVLRAP
ncbi:penicillin-insensitive murein endopeptidase [Methylopila henanensis]|uniref:Penicillin-insensitive murein endopeptidase n=1 Tax=Methylopila henanensis TaxID=873516 RepID=A0ABW4K891_9HYPH